MRLLCIPFLIGIMCFGLNVRGQGSFDLHLDSTKLLTPKPVPPSGPKVKPKEVRKPDSIIVWTSAAAFTWDDFWGKPDAKSKYTAACSSGIYFEDKPDPYTGLPITISCKFNKYRSWKNPKKQLDINLLIHEKVHFNISELHARKIRFECSKLNRNDPNAKAEMIAIYHRIVAELDKFQDEYDTATEHSVKEDKQTEWNMKVSSMMRDLTLFASRDTNKTD